MPWRRRNRILLEGNDDNQQAGYSGQDAGELAGVGRLGVPLSAHLNTDVDAVIDFSIPQAAEQIARLCIERKLPLVFATTGLSPAQKDLVADAADSIPLVWAPNMSLAVNLTMQLAAKAARGLRRGGG